MHGISKFMVTLFVGAALGLSSAHAGTLYKWVDSQGRVSYHDRPPPEGSGYRVEQKVVNTGSGSENDDALDKVIEQYPIVLYSVPVCGSCDLARAYLQKRKVPYTEHNLENNAELQQKLKTKIGSLSAPTILIGDKVMKGYVESLLEGELDAVGYPPLPSTTSAETTKDDEAVPSAAGSGSQSRRRY